MISDACIYAITCEDLVKIGISINPWIRVKAVTRPQDLKVPASIHGKPCKVLLAVEGTREDERKLHSDLEPGRMVQI